MISGVNASWVGVGVGVEMLGAGCGVDEQAGEFRLVWSPILIGLFRDQDMCFKGGRVCV